MLDFDWLLIVCVPYIKSGHHWHVISSSNATITRRIRHHHKMMSSTDSAHSAGEGAQDSAHSAGEGAQQDSGPSAGDGAPQQKKRARVSKKDVPDYKFDEDKEEIVAEFVKEHPIFYMKDNRHYSNIKMKTDLWHELAAKFDGCTWQQVKKFYARRRSDFGKVHKKVNKSGASARQSHTQKRLLNVWGFLGEHIVHEDTLQTLPDRDAETTDSDLSAHSIQRRRKMMRTKATVEASPNEPDDASPTYVIPEPLRCIVEKASEMTADRELTEKQRRIKNFLVYFKDVMEKVETPLLDYAEERVLSVVKAIARGEDKPPTAAAAEVAEVRPEPRQQQRQQQQQTTYQMPSPAAQFLYRHHPPSPISMGPPMMHQHLSALPMVSVPASQVLTQVMPGPSQSPQTPPIRTPNRDFLAAVDDMSPLNYVPQTPGGFLPIHYAPSPSPGPLQTPKTTPVKQSPEKQQEHNIEVDDTQ